MRPGASASEAEVGGWERGRGGGEAEAARSPPPPQPDPPTASWWAVHPLTSATKRTE